MSPTITTSYSSPYLPEHHHGARALLRHVLTDSEQECREGCQQGGLQNKMGTWNEDHNVTEQRRDYQVLGVM